MFVVPSSALIGNMFQVKVGTWNSVDRLGLAREEKDDGNMGEVHPMANKTFVITTVLVSFQIFPLGALRLCN